MLGPIFLRRWHLHNTHATIDTLPILNWNKIHDGGSLAFLYVDKNINLSKNKTGFIKSHFLHELWRSLQEQHVERFGFSDDFMSICRKQKEIFLLRQQRALNDDRSLNAFIRISEEELVAMQREGKGGNFWELKGALDRAGFNVVPSQTSVAEFYTHIQTLIKSSAKNKFKQEQ